MNHDALKLRCEMRRMSRAMLIRAVSTAWAWSRHPRTTGKDEALLKLEQAWGAQRLCQQVLDTVGHETWYGIDMDVFFLTHQTLTSCPNTKEGRTQAESKISALLRKANDQSTTAWIEENELIKAEERKVQA